MLRMRWWRCKGVGVGGLKNAVSIGLLLAGSLTFAGCATSATNGADVYLSAAPKSAERAEREGDGTMAAVHQAPAEPSEPARGEPASVSGGPLATLLSGLLGRPAQVSSTIAEEALIARAVAEHEMRNP